MIAPSDWSSQLEFRRHQLGMNKSTVAKRSGVSIPTVDRILSGREKNPRFSNVQAIAAALGIELRLHETQSAQEFRKVQATAKAQRLVRMVQGTMGLEAQGVDSETLEGMIDQATCELLAGSARKLWDD